MPQFNSPAASPKNERGKAPEQGQQKQQQQPPRSRRPRSIHITLRKTRSGSRPVNIQRSQLHFFAGSTERATSPTGTRAAHNSSRHDVKDGADVNPSFNEDTILHVNPADPQRNHKFVSSRRRDPSSTAHSRYTDDSSAGGGSGGVAPLTDTHISHNRMAGTGHPGGHSKARRNSDLTNGQHSGVPSNGGTNGSGIGSSDASAGPSWSSGCAPPPLSAFMRAPHTILQQLLPPSMRDRLGNSNINSISMNSSSSSSRRNVENGSPATLVDVRTVPYFQQNSVALDGGGGTTGSNGYSNPLRSCSQVYGRSPNMTPARKSTTRANGRQLRSSSSVGQCDSTSGSYPSVLGDFVFPYPDRGAARQQSTTPSIAPTESLDLRSPRLSLPASANTNTIAEVPPQPRARSYTVGGGSCKSRHRGHRNSNGLVITASMAGAGGAALFGNHVRTSSMSHAESYASRNSDRSLSLSSIPAASGRGGVTVHAVTGVAGATTLLHSAVNTMREGTPVNAATTAMLQVPVEPTTPPPQPPRLQQRPPLTPCAVGMPAQQGGSTHKSESFVTQRSASSDFVNGLDDSADSVLCGSTPLRPSTNAFCGPTGTYRYAMDSIAGDGGLLPHSGTPSAADGRRPRRYSITLADDDDNAHNASSVSTLDRLRSRRDGRNPHNSNAAVATRPMPMTAAPHSHTHARCAEHLDASSEPKTAIERWRAQEEQKRREESTPVQRHRLSARQWREAFHRLEENRLKWTMRSFIGAGTSGKVYEGVLEDAAHTPVAVKVLDVGVPMPVGPSTVATANEDGNMSPDQQEALLVLLREVEMMEKLHQRNIVTCLRCQVTPVHDRFMELHHKQQQQQPHRPSSLARPSDGAGSDDVKGVRHNANASPQRSPTAAAATRIPVQVEIIMELCKRGTLASVVRRSPGGQLPVVTARRYLRDVLKGLAYLHGNNFIHRDVKGENVLISADDVAKLADFGCSRRIVMTNSHVPGEGHDGTMSSIATTHATDSRYTTMVDYQWCEATGVAQTMVGTPMFMAPEIIQASGASPATPCSADSTEHGSGNTHHNNVHHGSAAAAAPLGYTASADIWSFGCLVLEVFGRTPWPTAGNNVYRLMKQIEQSVDDMPPGVPQNTPQELLDVLRRCFRRDPHRRSTARMLLRSTWMTCKDEELEEMPSRRQR